MMRTKRSLLLFYCLSLGGLFTLAYPRNPKDSPIFLDLGGVVFKTDTLQAIKSTGITPFTHVIVDGLYKLDPHAFHDISKKVRSQYLYPFLEKLQPYKKDSIPAYDDHGNRMPQVMVEWMKGTMSGPAIKARIREAVALNSSWFSHEGEKAIITAVTTLMFTPNRLADSQKIMPESVDFVRECVAKGHPIYVLSNWDAASFALLKKRHQGFFNCMDGIVVSGTCGQLKPEPTIYDYILKTYNLDPSSCFFIDDIPVNIQAAQDAGISGAVCKNNDIGTIRSAYQAWVQE